MTEETTAAAGSDDDRVKQLEQEGDIAADYLEGLLDIADFDGDIDMDVEGDRAMVSIVGAEEAFPVIARLYRVGNLVGVPWIPVTPTFPLCGLAGALPLPTRWSMHFGEPIFAAPADSGQDEERRIAETTERVRTAISTGLTDLLAKRRGIFV